MKLNKRYRHFTWQQWLKIALIYSAGAFFALSLGLYGDFSSEAFIRGCVIETAFAFATNWFQLPDFALFIIYSLAAILITLFECIVFSEFRPAGLTFLLYPIISISMTFVRFNVPLPKWFIVPSYIPLGFKQVDYGASWGNKGRPTIRQQSAELIFEDENGGKFEVSGVIPENPIEMGKDYQTTTTQIKGVEILFNENVVTKTPDFQVQKNLPLLKAWWFNHAYYTFNGEGLRKEEVEKVIASMIPDEPESSSQKEGA